MKSGGLPLTHEIIKRKKVLFIIRCLVTGLKPSLIYIRMAFFSRLSASESNSVTQRNIHLQCYPNPFHTETEIWISCPAAGNVRLEIYNSAGQLMDVLVDHLFTSGDYSLKWNPGELSFGIYYCRLYTARENSTIKLVYR